MSSKNRSAQLTELATMIRDLDPSSGELGDVIGTETLNHLHDQWRRDLMLGMDRETTEKIARQHELDLVEDLENKDIVRLAEDRLDDYYVIEKDDKQSIVEIADAAGMIATDQSEDYIHPAGDLDDAVHRRHDDEHIGSFAMCMDPICDAVQRAQSAIALT